MWRKCDLHRHTVPDEQGDFEFDPDCFLRDCHGDGLDVVAVTDHDQIDNVHSVVEAAENSDIVVVPGVEITTERGHILALAPGDEGLIVLDEYCNRIPVIKSKTMDFSRLIEVLLESRASGESLFRNHVILVGAHVDGSGSILGPGQPPPASNQVSQAQRLQALEVVNDENLKAGSKE